jgi:UV DNA damage endonuclease
MRIRRSRKDEEKNNSTREDEEIKGIKVEKLTKKKTKSVSVSKLKGSKNITKIVKLKKVEEKQEEIELSLRKSKKSKSKSKNSPRKSKEKSAIESEEKEEEENINPSEVSININLTSKSKKMLITSLSANISGPTRIRLGLCCINNYLRMQKESIFCSRSIVLATYKSKGKVEAMDRGLKNVKDISKLIQWNENHNIECLRLSSDLFPHYTNIRNIELENRYTLDFVKDELKAAGNFAKKLNHRITMHPGQFNVVGTPTETTFESTKADLKMHADVLDMMGLDGNSILVVHGGGTYGDKPATIKRWIKNFRRLDDNVQKRLVLENCEKNFSVIDCLEISKELNIPVVFDNHHFECYKKLHPGEKFENIETYIKAVLETWKKKGLRPKFHISEQNPEKHVGAHSDYIKTFPDYYLEIPKKYGVGVDIMVEAKAKEAAIFRLFNQYRNDFLSHVKDIPKDMYKYDEENMQAIECKKCLI